MNKKIALFSAAGALLLGGILVSNAFASNLQRGNFYSPERHGQMMQAFNQNDYQSWRGMMQGRGAASKVNEQNFSRFSQMHQLMLDGKIDEANKIRQELGMGQGRGMMGGQRGRSAGGNFIDQNKDGICDRMQ